MTVLLLTVAKGIGLRISLACAGYDLWRSHSVLQKKPATVVDPGRVAYFREVKSPENLTGQVYLQNRQ